MRQAARRLGGLALLLLVGCSSTDLSVDPLDSAFRRRGRGACDGFVFVPTRQAVGGTTIPHAIIEIIPLPITRTDGTTDTHSIDEGIRFDVTLDGIRGVKLIAEGGRIYRATDSFTRADHFRAMEPRLEKWSQVRRRWDPELRIRSAQSVRVLGDPV